MIVNDFSWKIAGAAGDGILNAGLMFARMCMRAGMHVFAAAEYPSLIRGGHNHLDVHVSEQPIYSHTDSVTVLVAMNMESVEKHITKIPPGGALIYDAEETKLSPAEIRGDIRLCNIPLLRYANECGGRIMRNVVAMGATIALLGYELEPFNAVLRDNFGTKKGDAVVNDNIKAAQLGYQFIKDNFPDDFAFRLVARGKNSKIFVSGNEAISLGAIKAGCKFFAAYPMTPASSILHTMAAHEKAYGIVVKHTEDEIAAINMTVGAAFAGVRAMTSTSGGGFALMTEGLGLAAQTETPLVIVEAQRPGPATGMATHSGQGDLRFVIHAGTDEFPRVIIAPGDVSECYYKTIEAFNIAEKYQLPAIILTDKYLGESFSSTDEFSDTVPIERGALLSEEQLNGDYKRYQITESGVSPRSIPGQKGGEHVASSYEHDELGFEREEPEIRIAMHDKRFRKMAALEKEVVHPKVMGNGYADVTLVSWGSTKGPIRDALRLLEQKGIYANYYQILYISPFPTKELAELLGTAPLPVVVENNKTSLLSGLIREKTGYDIRHKILKYDGRPFSAELICEKVLKLVEKQRTSAMAERISVIE